MISKSSLLNRDYSQILHISALFCPCKLQDDSIRRGRSLNIPFVVARPRRRNGREPTGVFLHNNSNSCRRWILRTSMVATDGRSQNLSTDLANSTRRGAKSLVVKRFEEELDHGELAQESSSHMLTTGTNFTTFQEDPLVDKLRTQLGVIHPMPSPPINRNILGLFAFFFFVGVAFDKLWTSRRKKKTSSEGLAASWPQVPTSFSLFLEKDLQRKESVEWVNMVLGKLWQVYRPGLENWLIGLLQPVIDNLKKPDYVQRVEIKQFSLGDEPLSVRNVERRTSRRVNDLQ